MDSPYSTCRKDTSTVLSTDSSYFQATIKITKYSRKLCYEICLNSKLIVAKCGCADPSVPITDSTQTICYKYTDLQCVDQVRINYTDLSSYCSSYCPLG